ncbi:MAG: hypothetical protein AAGG51_27685 [Cyanobacteria bacterium P01_G01_bin.54]
MSQNSPFAVRATISALLSYLPERQTDANYGDRTQDLARGAT